MTCKLCNGTGVVTEVLSQVGEPQDYQPVDCPQCTGKGNTVIDAQEQEKAAILEAITSFETESSGSHWAQQAAELLWGMVRGDDKNRLGEIRNNLAVEAFLGDAEEDELATVIALEQRIDAWGKAQ